MATNTKSATTSSNTRPRRLLNAPMVQNFHLVWLDESIDEANDTYHNSIVKLREVIHTVTTFVDVDECIDFTTDITEKAFVVISGKLSPDVVSLIQGIFQVFRVYIFYPNDVPYETQTKESININGMFTDITSVCKTLRQATKECDDNSVSIGFMKNTDATANQSSDTLEPSFMYTQILKEILLTIDFEQVHFNEFISYCRAQFVDSTSQMKHVDKIETEYYNYQPIWWYTHPCFLSSMLNRALRTMEADLLVNMGLFIRDLDKHIETLHSQQYGTHNHLNSFTVYRGQGLSQTDFNQLKATQGGLISFNNFLSTSLDRSVSLAFAESNQSSPDSIGVLFEMKIDPSMSSFTFANVKNVSHFQEEEEVLFSMHSVFRIGQVKQIDTKNNRLWQVELTLTGDHDPHLQKLRESMRNDTKGLTGWFRLGELMIQVAQFDKAQQVFQMILDRETDGNQRAMINNNIGLIKLHQGKYSNAITDIENSLQILEKSFPPNYPSLATSYNNIGGVHKNMGEYSKALSYYEKTLEIRQKTLPANHPDLANSYNNIGGVHKNMGEYSKALSYYEKALEIDQKVLPSNRPSLATTYNNIGGVHRNMGEYSKALSYYEKALGIDQKTLPSNHPSLATTYNNIGGVHNNMGEYWKALSYYEKALEIQQKTLPSNHPILATTYNSIGEVHRNMGEYSKALSYYEKALEIQQKTLPSNHPILATTYNSIGEVHRNMGEYSKALSYYEKALEIQQKTLPANHPNLGTSYNNIGGAHRNMGEYSKALSYYKKALEIRQKTLSANHPKLGTSNNNIGLVYGNMGEYSKALSYYEKALEIQQKTLPSNHPHLGTSYNNIGGVHNNMGEYSKALAYYEKALEIRQKTLPTNHPSLANSYNNLGDMYGTMGEYSKALPYYERALGICQRSLPPNHPHLTIVKNNIEILKKKSK